MPSGRIFDISRELYAGMPIYPGDPEFSSRAVSELDPADETSCALTAIGLSTHCGTHLDAPAHFMAGGASVDRAPLGLLCGQARLLALPGPAVDAGALAAWDLREVERLLIRTGSHRGHLTPDAASMLRDRTAVRLVGIDSMSIGSQGSGHRVHRILLCGQEPIWILEGLDLDGVPPGAYELCCLPLKIRGADGAPARVILQGG
ncbi:MAG: cyclase family protein [Deltaproteobacteria bacterium]|nr:cyclase family protein [Deltaproteobacteria bacterium]